MARKMGRWPGNGRGDLAQTAHVLGGVVDLQERLRRREADARRRAERELPEILNMAIILKASGGEVTLTPEDIQRVNACEWEVEHDEQGNVTIRVFEVEDTPEEEATE